MTNPWKVPTKNVEKNEKVGVRDFVRDFGFVGFPEKDGCQGIQGIPRIFPGFSSNLPKTVR